ncbi:hypothetical protein LguiA_015532 [Lonicera macranthoides]
MSNKEFNKSIIEHVIDFSDLNCITPSVGWFGREEEARRIMKVQCYSTESTPNFYMRPIKGLTLTVDIDKRQVIKVSDIGKGISVPRFAGTDYRYTEGSRSTEMDSINPILIEQSKGQKLGTLGVSLVRLQVRDSEIGLKNNVMYKGFALKLFVSYMDKDESWCFKMYVDASEFELGVTAMSLMPLNDCPNTQSKFAPMAEIVKQILARSIQLADQVTKIADEDQGRLEDILSWVGILRFKIFKCGRKNQDFLFEFIWVTMDESQQTSCKMNLEEEKSLSKEQTEKSTNSGCSIFCGGSENFFVASIDSVLEPHTPSASAAIMVSMVAMASNRQPHISHPNTSAPTIFFDVCLGFDPPNSCCYVDLQAAQRRLEDLLCSFFVGLSGMLMVKGTSYENIYQVPNINEMSGPLVSENMIGVVHDHFITFHLDMDINDTNNSFVKVNLVKEESLSGTSPRKSYLKAKRHVVKTENDAKIKLKLYDPLEFHLVNPSRLFKLVNPTGYKVVPGGTVASLLYLLDPPQIIGVFTNNQ